MFNLKKFKRIMTKLRKQQRVLCCVLEQRPEKSQKILDEAIRELKRTSFKNVFKEEISKQDDFVSDCTIDTDLEILIPDDYVESITERLSLYTRLDNCENESELQAFEKEIGRASCRERV